jgi:hypothetical protein
LEGFKTARKTASERFTRDYVLEKQQGRYVKALPIFAFGDKSFDLVLSGHFLFIYSDYFRLSFSSTSDY